MVPDVGKGTQCRLFPTAPGVMEIERRTLVNQPQLTVPQQHVRVSSCAVDVREESVEPDEPGGRQRVGMISYYVPRQRAVEEMYAEIQPPLPRSRS